MRAKQSATLRFAPAPMGAAGSELGAVFGPRGRTVARERRASRRRALATDVVVRHVLDEGQAADEAMVLPSVNVSASGIFLRSELVLPMGEKLELAFALPAGAQIQVRGEVTRVELGGSDASRPPGMGIAFRDIDVPTRRTLKLYAD